MTELGQIACCCGACWYIATYCACQGELQYEFGVPCEQIEAMIPQGDNRVIIFRPSSVSNTVALPIYPCLEVSRNHPKVFSAPQFSVSIGRTYSTCEACCKKKTCFTRWVECSECPSGAPDLWTHCPPWPLGWSMKFNNKCYRQAGHFTVPGGPVIGIPPGHWTDCQACCESLPPPPLPNCCGCLNTIEAWIPQQTWWCADNPGYPLTLEPFSVQAARSPCTDPTLPNVCQWEFHGRNMAIGPSGNCPPLSSRPDLMDLDVYIAPSAICSSGPPVVYRWRFNWVSIFHCSQTAGCIACSGQGLCFSPAIPNCRQCPCGDYPETHFGGQCGYSFSGQPQVIC